MKFIAVFLELGVEIVLRHDAEFFQRSHTRISHHVGFKVQHALDIAQGHIQDQAQTAWQRLQKPDVGARRSKVNVTHAFTTNLGLCNFNAALLADHATVLQTLVLTAQAFVVLDGTKNLGAKQTVALGLEGAVVDSFRLLDLTERP